MSTLGMQSAIELAGRIAQRDLSAVECLEYFLRRVERFDGALNAVVVRDFERARRRAEAADAAQARGELWGALHGVPMTIKESFDVAGLSSTWGDTNYRNQIAEHDDPVVTRLQNAGAVIFGKTNVPYQLVDMQSYNDIYGVTRNPWNPERTPGGSSGGAAAALAAGMTAVEVGSDLAGSIRNPSHCCGVFGHKSTAGVVPTRAHTPPGIDATGDLAVVGPLARSAEDLAFVLGLISGPDPFAAPAWRLELPKPTKSLREYRVAVWADDGNAPVDREVSDRCQAVADALAKAGATVSDTARPKLDPSAAFSVYRKLLRADVSWAGGKLSHSEWMWVDNERMGLRMRWREFFESWDVVLCPVAATPAFAHDHSALRERQLRVNGADQPYFQQLFWSGLASAMYLPSTVFPTGVGSEGLPIGLQAMGAEHHDLVTIEFARLHALHYGGFAPPSGYED